MYMHGITFGGHPIAAAVALQEIEDHGAARALIENVRAQ